VVAVADTTPADEHDEIGDPICDCCGEVIEVPDQECPARDDGRCFP